MFSLLCNTYFLGENGRLQARFRENVKPTNGKSFPVKPLPSWDKPLYFSKWLTGSGLSGSNSSKCDVSVAPSKLGTYGGTTKRKKKQTNKQNNEEFWECQRLCAEFFSQTSQRLRALKWVQLVNLNRFCLDGKPNGTVTWSRNINVYPKTDHKRQYGGLPVFYFTSLFFVWFFRFYLPPNFQLYPKVAQNVSFFGRTGRWSHQYQRR